MSLPPLDALSEVSDQAREAPRRPPASVRRLARYHGSPTDPWPDC